MMKMKMLFTALALSVAPALAMADCAYHTQKQAMSCADGMEYNTDSKSCVPVTG